MPKTEDWTEMPIDVLLPCIIARISATFVVGMRGGFESRLLWESMYLQ